MNIQVFLVVVGVVLALIGVVLPTANAQMQLTQSSNINDNEQRIDLRTESTSATGSTAQEKISIPNGGKADIILKLGELEIHYCGEGIHCHSYVLFRMEP